MTMRTLSLLVLLSLTLTHATAQVPDTDIWLIDMDYDKGDFTFGTPENITDREGYDNQPYFLPSNEGVFYSSTRDGAMTDIFLYYYVNKEHYNVTNTGETSEFSPTMTPDGKHFTVVRVEEDSTTQRLWNFVVPGTDPKVLWAKNKQIGYYAWVDNDRIAAFVLGDSFTLRLINLKTNSEELLAAHIGRCISTVPGTKSVISYVYKPLMDTTWYIMRMDLASREARIVAPTLPGSEDYLWLSDGSLLMGNAGKLYHLRPGKDTAWKQVADFRKSIGPFYRLALSPRTDRIAVVGYRGDKP